MNVFYPNSKKWVLYLVGINFRWCAILSITVQKDVWRSAFVFCGQIIHIYNLVFETVRLSNVFRSLLYLLVVRRRPEKLI